MNEITNYDQWGIEKLRTRLDELLAAAARSMVEIARVACALEAKGVHLPQFKSDLMNNLRLLAKGILVEEAANLIPERPALVRRLAKLPPAQQKELLSGQEIPVVVDDNGNRTTVQIPLEKMEFKQIKQVFADSHVRTVAEQMVYRQNRDEPRREAPKALPTYEVRDNCVIFNVAPCRMPFATLKKILKDNDAI